MSEDPMQRQSTGVDPDEPGLGRNLDPDVIDLVSQRRNVAIDLVRGQLAKMWDRLPGQSMFVKHRIGELRSTRTGLIIGYTFAGGEFQFTLMGGPIVNPVKLRINQAALARDPDFVNNLWSIIGALEADYRLAMFVDSGGTWLGMGTWLDGPAPDDRRGFSHFVGQHPDEIGRPQDPSTPVDPRLNGHG